MADKQYDPEEFRLENEEEVEMERYHHLEFRITLRRHGRRSKVTESTGKVIRRSLELALGTAGFDLYVVNPKEVPASE